MESAKQKSARNARTKNRWGEGARLRDEIIAAASSLLEETGSEDALSLRAVARRAGIAAPSIYPHFPDLAAIVNAVVAQAFVDLDESLRPAAAGVTRGAAGTAPARRLRRVCEAYLDFAAHSPHRYRVAFDRYRTGPGSLAPGTPLDGLSGGTAFGRLVECVRATGVPERRVMLTATALWAGLHGYASLRSSVPAFPWPDRDAMLTELLRHHTT